MRAAPVLRAASGGVTRRKVQTVVIGLVLLVGTGACVLALGLVVDSNAPFDSAFAAQRGAHAVVTVDAGKATRADLAATARVSGVTDAAGPFAEATITPGLPGPPGSACQVTAPPMTLAGRASPGGPLDDLILQQGRWARRPGEVVLSSNYRYGLPLGARLTVTGVPGTPQLTVVGIANSINQSADGWVVPGQIAALRTPGTPPAAQMLYRFVSAGTAAAVRADVAAVAAALPPGAVTTSQSYLTIKLQQSSGIAPIVPFVVAFACLGLVMSVLIVINVISSAVVAGYRRIGILKSIGFTPGQVVGAYTGQVLAPGLAGLPGWCAARQRARGAVARPDGGGVRGRHAAGAGLGGRGGSGRHGLPGRHQRACCRRCGPDGSARSRRSPPAAPRERAAATPRTGR